LAAAAVLTALVVFESAGFVLGLAAEPVACRVIFFAGAFLTTFPVVFAGWAALLTLFTPGFAACFLMALFLVNGFLSTFLVAFAFEVARAGFLATFFVFFAAIDR
jgi:hypothetical protein